MTQESLEAQKPRMAHRGFGRLLKEPLVHFFAVAAVLFGAHSYLEEPSPPTASEGTIVISEDDVRRIAVSWMSQGRPALTTGQMLELIDQQIDQEVLYREGLALGLDRDDEIIKRRIAQKMDFLAADIATLQAPPQEELRDWFQQRAGDFTLPPRFSFRQLYFSPDQRGTAVYKDALAARDLLRNAVLDDQNASALSDRFMLREYYDSATPSQVLKAFGPVFASAILGLEPLRWHGPIESGYGWHLVFIEDVEPERIPAFEEVEQEVKAAWVEARYREIKQLALAEMRARYTVVVPSLEEVDLNDFGNRGLSAPAEDQLTQ